VITIEDISDERVVAHELLFVKLETSAQTRRDVLDIVDIFRGRVVDVASDTVIVEVTGSEEKIDNFLQLVTPFGIKEVARSGAVAMVRGNLARLRLVPDHPDQPVPAGPPAAKAGATTAGDMTGNV
jgi:acetolactate synthase-1/3 small subunit